MGATRLIRTLGFLAALALPLVTMSETGALSGEQRARVARPALSVAAEKYPEQFDTYFQDNFGFRPTLIRWHHLFKFWYLSQSPVPNVIIGRDRWLFYAGLGDGIDIRDFSGRWPHSDSQIDAWLAAQEVRREAYARHGAVYLIAIAPNKHSVYPEDVPRQYGPQAPGVLDSLLKRAARHPRLQLLDLRPALIARRDAPAYYRADSHWNTHGAFFAAQAILDALRPTIPTIGGLRPTDYGVTSRAIDSGDLVNMLGLGLGVDDHAYSYERRTPGAIPVQSEDLHRTWEQADRHLPSAVLLGDSFGGELAPRLADGFSKLHYYYSMRGGFNPELIPRERPDVVVLLLVERYLGFLESQ